jgi:hypothetical protein
MMVKTLITRLSALLFLFLALTVQGQVLYETGLNCNPTLVKKHAELLSRSALKLPAITDTISLGPKGFLDDFSKAGPYPDTTLWLDNFTFINRTYGKAPVTLGVATFDGMNAAGIPYDWGATSTSASIADYLTSKPIDLSIVAQNDTTVYLSFYYQPEGLGNDPEMKDSLVVEFKGVTGGWRHVWAKRGIPLASSDSSWTLVMIPVNDSTYLQKGFQFRFKNYATLLGNLDHWSIDYVYLNRNRSMADTSFEDVAFVYETPSLLNTYTAMPWRHYATTDMRTDYSSVMRNNHSVVKNVSLQYRIFDELGVQVNTTYSGGSVNMDPYDTVGYYYWNGATIPPMSMNYTIPVPLAPTAYTIQSILNTTPDFDRQNDTVEHVQNFGNYYAYDDGSAESAIGAYTTGATIDIAQRFNVTTADSLRYLDIYFNPIVNNASFYSFKIKVYNVSGSTPGTLLFTSAADLQPAYYGTGTDIFIRYPLSTPQLLSAGSYYIGIQENGSWFLNIGLDKSRNTSDKVYYNANVGGGWESSPFVGSMMMRPVFGSTADFVGIAEQNSPDAFSVYPNPANDRLFFRSGNVVLAEDISYEIIDLYGRIIRTATTSDASADVSALSNGIYFIRFGTGAKSGTGKFVISR